MPIKEGFANLQTVDGIELVPNTNRLIPKSNKMLIKKFEKGSPEKGIKQLRKRDEMTISTGFTSLSSETKKVSSDETKVSKLETIYEKESRS